MMILGTSYFVPVALTFTVALLLGFFLGALMMHRRGKYLKSISTHGSAPSSEVAEDILKTFNEYFELSFRTSREGFPRFWRPDFAEVEAVWQLWVVGATPWQGLVALRAFAALTPQATDFTAGLC